MTPDDQPITPPRTRFREMVRDDILAAARKIMQRDGYQALSMRSLAGAVGMSASSLYDYFASKDDVLNAIFLQGIAALDGGFAELIAIIPPGIGRLIQMGIEYRQFALDNPDIYQLLFARIDQAYYPGPDQIAAARRLFASLVAQVAAAISVGELREGNPELLALTFWSLTHGYVSLELVRHIDICDPALSGDVQFRFALQTILAGLTQTIDSE